MFVGSNDKAKQKLLLSLAERMMKKLHDEGKIDAEQEVSFLHGKLNVYQSVKL